MTKEHHFGAELLDRVIANVQAWVETDVHPSTYVFKYPKMEGSVRIKRTEIMWNFCEEVKKS